MMREPEDARLEVVRGTEPAFSHPPFFDVYLDDVGHGGLTQRYARIVESSGRPGAVVVPIRASHIGLIQIFRPAIGAYSWELPRGFGESTDPLETARLELKEEFGINDATRSSLGPVYANTGLVATPIIVVVAQIPPQRDAAVLPGHEGIVHHRWWSTGELAAAITDGTITDGITIAALCKAFFAGVVPLHSPPTAGGSWA